MYASACAVCVCMCVRACVRACVQVRALISSLYSLLSVKSYYPHNLNSPSMPAPLLSLQLLLFEETNGTDYLTEVQNFLSSWRPGGKKIYTPCGLAIYSHGIAWGTARHACKHAQPSLSSRYSCVLKALIHEAFQPYGEKDHPNLMLMDPSV